LSNADKGAVGLIPALELASLTVQREEYMAEEDTWEPRENLGNAEDLVKEFEEEYSEIRRVKKRRNDKEDRKGELPGRYIAKMLYG